MCGYFIDISAVSHEVVMALNLASRPKSKWPYVEYSRFYCKRLHTRLGLVGMGVELGLPPASLNGYRSRMLGFSGNGTLLD